MRVTLSLLLAFVMSLLSSQLYCQGRWDDYDEYSPEDSLTIIIAAFPCIVGFDPDLFLGHLFRL
jgi:hypothetical protein